MVDESTQNAPRRKHYVVTEDLEVLIDEWCTSRDLITPDTAVFARLQASFTQAITSLGLGAGADQPLVLRYLPREDWRFDSLRRPDQSDAYWISLDRVYAPEADAFLEINRVFDDRARGGYMPGPRVNAQQRSMDGIETQLGRCVDGYQARHAPEEVILVDDGAYSGRTTIRVLRALDARQIHVTELRLAFCTVQAVAELADYFSARDPRMPPITVSTGMLVGEAYLLDWVCERDFYIGVPRSGRTEGTASETYARPHVKEGELGLVTVGRPYLLGWGPLGAGASITSGDRQEFSARMTDMSIRLWQAVESANEGLVLRVSDLPRYPLADETFDENGDRSAIDFLESVEQVYFGRGRKTMREADVWDVEE